MNATEFNERYPVGTHCIYHSLRPAKGPGVRTSTRSEAWDLTHGDTIVAIEGKSGGVDVGHLDMWPSVTRNTGENETGDGNG